MHSYSIKNSSPSVQWNSKGNIKTLQYQAHQQTKGEIIKSTGRNLNSKSQFFISCKLKSLVIPKAKDFKAQTSFCLISSRSVSITVAIPSANAA